MHHITLVVGDRYTKGHDQCAALQFVIEQRASCNRHADTGNRRLDGQVVAVESVPAPHIQAGGADAFQVELPLGIFRTATPGGDVMQQRVVRQVSGAVQRRAPAQQPEFLFIQ